MANCTFFGHRDCPETIKPRLRAVLIDLITNHDVDMLDAYPNLRGMYSEDDGNTQVLYMKNAVATISSFGGAPVVIEF